MKTLVTRSIVLVIGTIFGAILGLIASKSVSGYVATAVVSIGKIGSNESIEEPLSVLERMKTARFASAVAASAGRQDSAFLLPVETLSARTLRDLNLIEIRVVSANPELAQTALAAVTNELQTEHAKKISPLAQSLKTDLATLEGLQAEITKTSDALTKQIRVDDRTDEGVISAQASSSNVLAKILEDKFRLRDAALHVRETTIVAEHAIVEMNYSYRLVATGALAGFLTGLFLNLMFGERLQLVKSFPSTKRPDLA